MRDNKLTGYFGSHILVSYPHMPTDAELPANVSWE